MKIIKIVVAIVYSMFEKRGNETIQIPQIPK